MILPDAVDDRTVEALVVLLKPMLHFWRVAVGENSRAEGVNRAIDGGLECWVRGIEGGDFYFIAGLAVCLHEHTDRFAGAASVRIDGVNQVK